MARRPYEKLAARLYGPLKIIQLVSKVAYKLELPSTSKIHPVFHVSQLKRCIGSAPFSAALPLQLNPELELEVEPKEVLAVRIIQVGNSNREELLIRWKGLQDFEATWEDKLLISQCFPNLRLEAKANFDGEGNVIHPGPVQPGLATRVFARQWPKGKMVNVYQGQKGNCSG